MDLEACLSGTPFSIEAGDEVPDEFNAARAAGRCLAAEALLGVAAVRLGVSSFGSTRCGLDAGSC